MVTAFQFHETVRLVMIFKRILHDTALIKQNHRVIVPVDEQDGSIGFEFAAEHRNAAEELLAASSDWV